MNKLIILFSIFITAIVVNAGIKTNEDIFKLKNTLSCQTLASAMKDLTEDTLVTELKSIKSDQINNEILLFLNQSWNLRLVINQNLVELKPCISDVRKVIFNLRGMEDLVGFRLSGIKAMTSASIEFKKQPIPLMEVSNNYSIFNKESVNAQVDNTFESGDLLVTRGASFFSATLASITENPGDFSHFVMVHKEDVNGKVTTLESYAQTGGVDIFTIEDALKNENARILHLRPKFHEQAKLGSQLFYDKFLRERKGLEKRTGYDFAMNLSDPTTMTCSEIAYWAFYKASNGVIKIPEEASEVSPKLNDILGIAGIRKAPMLAPQDMEVDSRFEMLSEFKDNRLVIDSRMRDAILRNIFSWIKNKNYKLYHDWHSFFLTYLIHPISKTPIWPMVNGILNVTIPPQAPKGFVRLIYQINEMSEKIYNELDKVNTESLKTSGFALTKKQMDLVLEQIRVRDLEKYEKLKNSSFHSFFHP